VAAVFGDMVEHMPRRAAVHAMAENNVTAYSYRFNVLPAGVSAPIGLTHYQEVSWAFNNIDGAGYSSDPFNVTDPAKLAAYIEVSTLMSRMWASFATDLDPNNHGLSGYPTWLKYTLDTEGAGDNFVFDANVTSYVERDDYRVPGMAFLFEKAKEQWKF
jgi:carboxylesterase type B